MTHISVNDSFTPEFKMQSFASFTPRDDGGDWQIIDEEGIGNYVYKQSVTGDGAYHVGIMEGGLIEEGSIQTKFRLQGESGDEALVYFRIDEEKNGYVAQVKRNGNDCELRLYTASDYSLTAQMDSWDVVPFADLDSLKSVSTGAGVTVAILDGGIDKNLLNI